MLCSLRGVVDGGGEPEFGAESALVKMGLESTPGSFSLSDNLTSFENVFGASKGSGSSDRQISQLVRSG